jgi:hypothetical protein
MISSTTAGRRCFYNGHPRAKDALKICQPGSLCLVVEGQRHMRFPGVARTKSSILLTIRICQIWWRVTGLSTTLDAFNAIPRRGATCYATTFYNTVVLLQPISAHHQCADANYQLRRRCLLLRAREQIIALFN